ncbi:MAG: hypothetical protein RIN55_05570 [Tissierellaceae bacterium]|nr:hypothetical protein [Tissierellaceae bacterium]
MLSTEKAFEILPYISDIYEKIDVKDFVKKYKEKSKDIEGNEENQIIAGLDLFSYLFKQSGKITDELFSILSVIEDKKVEEIKKQPLKVTLGRIKEIFTDEDLVDFFKGAMQ